MTRFLVFVVVLVGVAACDRVPLEQPGPSEVVASWDALYMTNCAGCHGADGVRGAARPMADPSYLATVARADLARVISRGQGTLMPAFGASSGGPLSDAEVDRLVDGMREVWGKEGSASAVAWAGSEGDPQAGAGVYASFCQACHGQPDGRSAGLHGSVTDANYLRLVSDQALRSAVVFGRPDLQAGCAGPYAGQPASRRLGAQEVADVVAFLGSRRPHIGRSAP
jgi:mono/diheme cytochrome c family protein